jgi:hypothetical protein
MENSKELTGQGSLIGTGTTNLILNSVCVLTVVCTKSNGFYYNQNTGKYEGKLTTKQGNLNDVYVCIGKIGEGEQAQFVGAVKLEITEPKFVLMAATIYGESSAYAINDMTEELAHEMSAIASVLKKNHVAYGGTSTQAHVFKNASLEARNGTKKQLAVAAAINSLMNGPDFSNGATNWDGQEQSLYKDADKRAHASGFELHKNTMGWKISDELYLKWKTAVGSNFVAPQISVATHGANANKIRFVATAVYNKTIFWSVVNNAN